MKLLEKNKIRQNITEQRKADIDQGIILARKIDVLRETLLKEEQKAEKFRTETLAQIQKEIDDKMKENDGLKRNSLIVEIQGLEEKRAKLLEPLDKEWEEVNLERKKTLKLNIEIAKEKSKIISERKETERLFEKTKQDEQRVSQMKEQATKSLQTIERVQAEAKDLRENALKKDNEVNQQLGKRESEVVKKEKLIESSIKSLEIREKQIEEKEQDIINQQIVLADQRGVLERAMARITK
jgi:hypothetical protein